MLLLVLLSSLVLEVIVAENSALLASATVAANPPSTINRAAEPLASVGRVQRRVTASKLPLLDPTG